MGENGIYFQREIVVNPADFNDRFKRGDKILKVHIDGVGRNEIRNLIKFAFSSEAILQMEKAGYAGIYGNTGNKALRVLLFREKDGLEIDVPFSTRIKTILTGYYGTKFYGYPKTGSPRRIVFLLGTPDERPNNAMQTGQNAAQLAWHMPVESGFGGN